MAPETIRNLLINNPAIVRQGGKLVVSMPMEAVGGTWWMFVKKAFYGLDSSMIFCSLQTWCKNPLFFGSVWWGFCWLFFFEDAVTLVFVRFGHETGIPFSLMDLCFRGISIKVNPIRPWSYVNCIPIVNVLVEGVSQHIPWVHANTHDISWHDSLHPCEHVTVRKHLPFRWCYIEMSNLQLIWFKWYTVIDWVHATPTDATMQVGHFRQVILHLFGTSQIFTDLSCVFSRQIWHPMLFLLGEDSLSLIISNGLNECLKPARTKHVENTR